MRCSSSSSACTASCGTSTSCFGTSSVVQSAGSGFGCTWTVAVKIQSSLSDVGSSNSYSGIATGLTRARVAALQNQPPMWLSTASS